MAVEPDPLLADSEFGPLWLLLQHHLNDGVKSIGHTAQVDARAHGHAKRPLRFPYGAVAIAAELHWETAPKCAHLVDQPFCDKARLLR
jgi:hypothetical protein